MSGLFQIVYLVWLVSNGLIYLTLMLAAFARYSLQTERSRIPQMLLVGIRFGFTALGSVACCLALLSFDVATRAFTQSSDLLRERAVELAWYGMLASPFAVVTMIPMSITWIWMRRLRQMGTRLPPG
ncbi:MAG TPA: hypothetical protein VLE43_11575 [Candidatus Saccharimonadia bacterium]|nr:hypothetical protein [Candidatus Saccharimonadia bacterium]